MDPEEELQGRTAAFGDGVNGTPGSTAGLFADTQRQNSAVPHMFQPTSVLHQIMLSANGMSSRDADRRLLGGGMLPTGNSMSAQTNQASRPIISKYANL